VWLGWDLPGNLRGKSVLDVGTGTGFQALLCAARGAERVVGLDISPHAIEVARFNAALNGLDEKVEFRQSDLYGALAPGEQFDLIILGLPYRPAPPELFTPDSLSGGADGQAVIRPAMEGLEPYLSASGRLVAIYEGLGGATSSDAWQDFWRVAQEHGLSLRACVYERLKLDKYLQDKLLPSLEALNPSLSEEELHERVNRWRHELRAREQGCEYLYKQIIHGARADGVASFECEVAFEPTKVDPLIALVTP
jgi:methylase of polypeptide subunit release factors